MPLSLFGPSRCSGPSVNPLSPIPLLLHHSKKGRKATNTPYSSRKNQISRHLSFFGENKEDD